MPQYWNILNLKPVVRYLSLKSALCNQNSESLTFSDLFWEFDCFISNETGNVRFVINNVTDLYKSHKQNVLNSCLFLHFESQKN